MEYLVDFGAFVSISGLYSFRMKKERFTMGKVLLLILCCLYITGNHGRSDNRLIERYNNQRLNCRFESLTFNQNIPLLTWLSYVNSRNTNCFEILFNMTNTSANHWNVL